MNTFDLLSDKVHKAASQLIALKKEKQNLTSELDILRRDSRQHHILQRENDKLKRERDQLTTKLDRLNKKLERLLTAELALSGAGAHHEGGSFERHYE